MHTGRQSHCQHLWLDRILWHPFLSDSSQRYQGNASLDISYLKPGTVAVKDSVTSPVNLMQDNSWNLSKTELPPVVPSPGSHSNGSSISLTNQKILSCRLSRTCLPGAESIRALNTKASAVSVTFGLILLSFLMMVCMYTVWSGLIPPL